LLFNEQNREELKGKICWPNTAFQADEAASLINLHLCFLFAHFTGEMIETVCVESFF
jgi:hypothetical protein